MVTALLALGANMPSGTGGPETTLEAALAHLPDMDTRVLATSSWYRTAAVPAGSGPDFVNGAAAVGTVLTPEALLARLHEIEAGFGRVRRTRWAPRVCDIDIIAYGSLVRPDAEEQARWAGLPPDQASAATPEELILPHPRMQERAFVLVPLAEVAPGWRHPVTGLSVREMCDALPQHERAEIRPLSPAGRQSGDSG